MPRNEILEELNNVLDSGIDPWVILSKISEAEEVNSDDEIADDDTLSDNDKQAIVQSLMSGEIDDKKFKEMISSGDISKEDAQEIIAMMQQAQQQQEPTTEEIQISQINQIQDMTVRFSIYEKLNELNEKIDYFIDFFPDVSSSLYKNIEETKQFLEIVSNLVFSLEINLLYNLYFQIETSLIENFQKYLENSNNSESVEMINKMKGL